MSREVLIEVTDGGLVPRRATEGSAGYDLVFVSSDPVNIPAGRTCVFSTGIRMHVKDPEVAALILPRSGLGMDKGIILGNSIGLIDSDYTGQIKVSLWNRSGSGYTVSPGDRVCQMVFVPVLHPDLVAVDELLPSSARGEGGFGSTGR